ncbi:PREDICTED: T-cell receptor-associated transmembrane adapter 1-like [Elephantulus edwardii]|uniref:T-cell receptor-associated transmembrane adapter 1-like n=1 Tax=Elephantulus edwardii TaxID=28737 RepID=UPI0003F0B7B8|nr:PREDICTED: T-cell receptor-associated transmembrane adapter 1-like [Elephantulus edwardii]
MPGDPHEELTQFADVLLSPGGTTCTCEDLRGPHSSCSCTAHTGRADFWVVTCKNLSQVADVQRGQLGKPECSFVVWGLIAFLALALIISLIFNISHYVEKKRQGKIHMFPDDYILRDDEYFIEDTPIYGNLDNVAPEPTDENCYEQMKARPERSTSKLQVKHAAEEAQMCYASLDHSYKGKHGKPRKKETPRLHQNEDEPLYSMGAVISTISGTDNVPPENEAIEENIHDDPVRLFELIRAKEDPVN